MIPMAFDYEVAESVDHAIDLLGQHGEDSKLLAGGHSLIPIMRLRLAAPTVLIDLGRLEELRYVRDGGDPLARGAPTPPRAPPRPRRGRPPRRGRHAPPPRPALQRPGQGALRHRRLDSRSPGRPFRPA